MKSLKKFLALALALALCFAMALPVMAVDKTKLTMENPTPGHTYTVYQVFTGDVVQATDDAGNKLWQDAEGTIPKYVLSNVQYGQSFIGENGKVPESVLNGITNADNYARELLTATPAKLGNPISSSWNGTPLDVDTGYYVIVDNGPGEGAEDPDANSAYIVEIVGPTTIHPKTTIPELDKSVKNADDDDYSANDAITSEIGKLVEFKLTATIPSSELLKYAVTLGTGENAEKGVYSLVFNDTMSEGLTFVEFKDMMVGTANINNQDKTNYTRVQNGQQITITIPDLFKIIGEDEAVWAEKGYVNDAGNIVVTATYTAKLNEKAIVTSGDASGEGNTNFNKASLTYRNDPNTDGTGTTPEDKTYVYSFKLDIDKTADKSLADGGETLEGAGFTLYRMDKDTEGKTVWTELKFKTVAEEGKGTKYVLSEDEGAVAEIKSDANGKLNFTGLKAGTTYKLVETTTPGGYNTCADKYFTISATPEGDGEGAPKVESVTITQTESPDDTDAGITEDGVKLNIINKSGTLLPSTGGIGTTIFYAVGGALVVGAGILLFVKKRMGSKG